MVHLLLLFITAALINNFVLSYFLGICPFLGVTGKMDSAIGMGFAVIFVMVMTAISTWLINHYILIPFNVTYLSYAAYILVIASLVQLVEMFLEKNVPFLYQQLGIFLPLITTNCAILGVALFASLRNYSFIESIVFSLGAGAGFTLAMIIISSIREQLEFADVPKCLEGPGITLIVSGLLAMTFMGLAGLGG